MDQVHGERRGVAYGEDLLYEEPVDRAGGRNRRRGVDIDDLSGSDVVGRPLAGDVEDLGRNLELSHRR
jgi:hypothetical protein